MTFGELIISQAMASLFRSPPDIPRTLELPTIVSALLVRYNFSIRLSTTSSLAERPSFEPSRSCTRKSSVSLTVMYGKKLSSCLTKAAGTLESDASGKPSKNLSPDTSISFESFIRPATACINEVFPEPLGPIIARRRPGLATPDMDPSRMARFSPFPFLDERKKEIFSNDRVELDSDPTRSRSTSTTPSTDGDAPASSAAATPFFRLSRITKAANSTINSDAAECKDAAALTRRRKEDQ
mmetsp:Transcript_45258/g.88516  ORF Transcript_45258/g.88516 Transcript_45258/m.88516 type:complete len:240 (-) Transcript_45258:370-1089(-)